jgi:hypothetical protein
MYGALSRETKLFSLITETQLHKSYRIRAQLIFVFFFFIIIIIIMFDENRVLLIIKTAKITMKKTMQNSIPRSGNNIQEMCPQA